MFVSIRVVYLSRGRLRRGSVNTSLRHLGNARPWLEAHFPDIHFRWDRCVAFYR